MTRILLCLSLALTLALTLRAADPCVSGVPVGKRPGPYSFLVATGPQRGQQTCYICEQHEGNKPAAVVFARDTVRPARQAPRASSKRPGRERRTRATRCG